MILIDAGLPGVWNLADAATQAGMRTIVFGLADNPHPVESACRHGCRDALYTAATTRDVVDALEDARPPAPRPVEHPDAARLLHLAAGDVVEARPARHLGIVGSALIADRRKHMRAPAG